MLPRRADAGLRFLGEARRALGDPLGVPHLDLEALAPHRPVQGLLVLVLQAGLTEGVAGPYATTLLGDMGANVIKVERREGDWQRSAGKGGLSPVGGAQFIALKAFALGIPGHIQPMPRPAFSIVR